MATYTQAVDAQISQLLQLRGFVTPDMLAGFSPEDGASLLVQYVQVHAAEVDFVFDGQRLTWAQSAQPAAVPAPAEPPAVAPPAVHSGQPVPPSPVDQVMQLSQGKSLLDTPSSGSPYSKWMWWLPLVFGIIGGIAAWFFVKDLNARAARNMLLTGVAVQVVSGCLAVGMLGAVGGALSPTISGGSGASSSWTASPNGRVAFYYFGTST